MKTRSSQLSQLLDRCLMLSQHLVIWLVTRPWDLLWSGIPALLLASVMLFIAGYEWAGADSTTVRRYRAQLEFALEDSNAVAVRLLAQKLSELKVVPDEIRYARAVLAEDRGQLELASQLMHQLAPADRAGDPRAHYWVAERMRRDPAPRTEAQDKELAHHLEQALSNSRGQQTAHLLLAEMLRSQGQREEAAAHLEAVVLDRPELRLTLAELYSELGDPDRATPQLERAIEYFRKRVNTNPGDVEARLLWVRALMANGDFASAERALMDRIVFFERGRATGKQPKGGQAECERLQQAVVDVYLAWTDRVLEQGRGDLVPLMELLQRALSRSPEDARVLSRMGRLLDEPGRVGEQANASLSEALASDKMPASANLVLGIAAAARGDSDAARKHWKTGQDAVPQMPSLVNEVIQDLVSVQPPRNERAVLLADAAIEMWPDEPDLRETRGVILANAERWPESLADLQRALAARPDRTAIHQKLAEVYEKLGERDLAAKHRALADQRDRP